MYAGTDGIFNTLKKQSNKASLLIDASTIDPAVSRELAVKAQEIGSTFHDAPVSGGAYHYIAHPPPHLAQVSVAPRQAP